MLLLAMDFENKTEIKNKLSRCHFKMIYNLRLIKNYTECCSSFKCSNKGLKIIENLKGFINISENYLCNMKKRKI